MPIDNCKRCGRLFCKEQSQLCIPCMSIVQKNKVDIYEFIRKNSGVSIEEISERFEISMKELEGFLFSGAFGSAHELIKTQCAKCKCEMTVLNRVGYFCYQCNVKIEREVDNSKRVEDDSQAVEAKKPTVPVKISSPQEEKQTKAKPSTFGFKRLSQ